MYNKCSTLDISKVYGTENIHLLINKFMHTNIPNMTTKLIANFIKGHKAYTTFRNTTLTNDLLDDFL